MNESAPKAKRSVRAFETSLSLTATLGLAIACGGSSPPAPVEPAGPSPCPSGQAYDGTYCIPSGKGTPNGAGGAPSVPPTTGGGSSQVPDEPVLSGTGGATGGAALQPGAGGGGAVAAAEPALAAPVDITMAAAAGPMVQYVASTHLPAGSRPFGAPFAGQFQEGQWLLQRVQLTPGACYTVVAFGPTPIEDIRVGFYAVDADRPLSLAAEPLLEESEAGSQAVLGRKDQCFRPAVDQRDVWLAIIAVRGRGVVAAQIFQKEPSAR